MTMPIVLAEDEDLRWYAVHTKAGAEEAVVLQLNRQHFATWCPWLVRGPRRRFYGPERRPAFSRYVFVGLREWQSHYAVNSTIGVCTIVRLGEQPLRIPNAVMSALVQMADAGKLGVKEIEPGRTFDPGDLLRILTGPFENRIGEFVRLDNSGDVRLHLDVLGRKVETVVPLVGIE